MKTVFLTAAFVAMIGSGASASTYILDFDGNDPSLDSSASQVFNDPRIFTDDGISWSISTGGGLGAALFDSTCASYGAGCNGDADLRPAAQDTDVVAGNVLIQQRPSTAITPNDDAQTDEIRLTLLSDVKLRWTGVSAIDDGLYIFGTSVDAGPLGSISLANNSQTGTATFLSGILGMGDTIIIDFASATNSNDSPDSGAIDRLTFAVVPVPASFPLLLAGFGAFAAMRARKKRS